MISGSCHCGAIHVEVSEPPQTLIDCNCSICRRNGALWAIFRVEDVRVTARPEDTCDYIWGARKIKTVRCSHCGCVTHWEPLETNGELGVNFRNFEPSLAASVRIRRFDGADTWSYLEE